MAWKALLCCLVLPLVSPSKAGDVSPEKRIWPKKISNAGQFQKILSRNFTTVKPASPQVERNIVGWKSVSWTDEVVKTQTAAESSLGIPIPRTEEEPNSTTVTDSSFSTPAVGLRLQVNYDSNTWVDTGRGSIQKSTATPSAPCSQEADGIFLHIKATLTLTFIPETNFTCNGKQQGYYADTAIMCRVFHYCQGVEPKLSFMCPPCTVFNQETQLCDFWYNVNCGAISEISFAEYNREFLK